MLRPFRWALPLAAAGLLLSAGPARASSHAEAPLIAEDPAADNTDVYFFRSSENPNKVVVLANYIPLEEPTGGPTYKYFSDRVLYEIHLDRNNDGQEDLTFQFRFSTRVQTPGTFLPYLGPITQLTTDGATTVSGNNLNPNYNKYQVYSVALIDESARRPKPVLLASNVIVPPNNAGTATTPDFAALTQQAIHTIAGNGIRVFAGQIDDPFFIDLGATFDLLRVRPFRSLHVLQANDPRPDRNPAPDSLSGFNCHTIALELPITFLTGGQSIPSANDPRRFLGVYASAARPTTTVLRSPASPRADKRGGDGGPLISTSSSFVQVSRQGAPLVNELFLPIDHPKGLTRDRWNFTEPEDDSQFRKFFQFPEPALRLAQLYPVLRTVVPNINEQVNGFTGPRADLLGGVTPLLNFAPDFLRLDVSVPPNANPSPLGALGGDAQGFPNGRRLADDVVDIYVRAAAGALVPGEISVPAVNFTGTRLQFLNAVSLGDGVDLHENGRVPFRSTFPFAATAHGAIQPAHTGFDDPEKEGS
jgi:hypothetical protein